MRQIRSVKAALASLLILGLLLAADFATPAAAEDNVNNVTPIPMAPSESTMTVMLAPPSGTSPTNDRASASVVLQAGGLPDVHIILLDVPHTLRSVTVTSAVGDVWVSIPDDTSWAMHAMQYSGHQNLVDLLLEPRPRMGLLTIMLDYTDAPPQRVTIDATCAESEWRSDNDYCHRPQG